MHVVSQMHALEERIESETLGLKQALDSGDHAAASAFISELAGGFADLASQPVLQVASTQRAAAKLVGLFEQSSEAAANGSVAMATDLYVRAVEFVHVVHAIGAKHLPEEQVRGEFTFFVQETMAKAAALMS